MPYWKAPFAKKDLLTAVWESWHYFNKEYLFKLVKSMSERIQAILKGSRGATKY